MGEGGDVPGSGSDGTPPLINLKMWPFSSREWRIPPSSYVNIYTFRYLGSVYRIGGRISINSLVLVRKI